MSLLRFLFSSCEDLRFIRRFYSPFYLPFRCEGLNIALRLLHLLLFISLFSDDHPVGHHDHHPGMTVVDGSGVVSGPQSPTSSPVIQVSGLICFAGFVRLLASLADVIVYRTSWGDALLSRNWTLTRNVYFSLPFFSLSMFSLRLRACERMMIDFGFSRSCLSWKK